MLTASLWSLSPTRAPADSRKHVRIEPPTAAMSCQPPADRESSAGPAGTPRASAANVGPEAMTARLPVMVFLAAARPPSAPVIAQATTHAPATLFQ